MKKRKLVSMVEYGTEEQETWKSVVGYEGYYQISNKGNCRSILRSVLYSDGRIATFRSKNMKPIFTNYGYIKFRLTKNGISKSCFAHRLIALTFILNPEKKPEVNHIDGNKLNNQLENLEWVTSSENINHSFNLGYREKKFYGTSADLTIPIIQIVKGVNIKIWRSASEISAVLGLDSSSITKCCRGKANTCGGYNWAYL